VPTTFDPRLEVDGQPATIGQLWGLDLAARSHFTAMQVRGRGTLGLAFHLTRLDAATREMFGAGLDGDLVRGYIRHALGDDLADASVRVHVFRPGIPVADPASAADIGGTGGTGANGTGANGAGPVSVLVTVRPPAGPAGRAERLRLVTYQRPLAHLKHGGSYGQNFFGGMAEASGYDDALFASPDGVISESSIANIAVADGDELVWPDAPALRGVMMQVLQRELTRAGLPWRYGPVRVADLPRFSGALVTNSHGLAPVAAIDDLELPADGPAVAKAAAALAAAPYDPL
jgi:branched-subunit amino acid aminotransferase/4-amino-4-deoxychorismate lyase